MNDVTWIYLVGGIVAVVLIFTAFRALLLWFFLIDKRVNNQERIIKRLDKIIDVMDPPAAKDETDVKPQ